MTTKKTAKAKNKKTTKKAKKKAKTKTKPKTKEKKEPNPPGRPSKYKKVFAEQASKLCSLGAIDREIADFFGVSEQTINTWKKNYPEFLESIKGAKLEADARVVRSLFERATGYSHPEDKIFQYEGSPVIVPTVKRYPPDATSIIFWLKNRQSDNWSDKQEHKHTGNIGLGQILDEIDGKSRGLPADQA